ncbi:MAG: hypothetical protein ACXWQO_05305 [Bdellovibrionota bacterium]
MKLLLSCLFVVFTLSVQASEIDRSITLASILRSPSCSDDINCPPGSHCNNGICILRGTCNSDVNCAAGLHCHNHTCH